MHEVMLLLTFMRVQRMRTDTKWQDAVLYDSICGYKAKPVTEIKRSGIEVSVAEFIRIKGGLLFCCLFDTAVRGAIGI